MKILYVKDALAAEAMARVYQHRLNNLGEQVQRDENTIDVYNYGGILVARIQVRGKPAPPVDT